MTLPDRGQYGALVDGGEHRQQLAEVHRRHLWVAAAIHRRVRLIPFILPRDISLHLRAGDAGSGRGAGGGMCTRGTAGAGCGCRDSRRCGGGGCTSGDGAAAAPTLARLAHQLAVSIVSVVTVHARGGGASSGYCRGADGRVGWCCRGNDGCSRGRCCGGCAAGGAAATLGGSAARLGWSCRRGRGCCTISVYWNHPLTCQSNG